MARPGKKYIDHEHYWGSIVKFLNGTWYNYAILFSPCGTKRHMLNQTTYEMFAKDGEHVYEGIGEAEKSHFLRLLNIATNDDLDFMTISLNNQVFANAILRLIELNHKNFVPCDINIARYIDVFVTKAKKFCARIALPGEVPYEVTVGGWSWKNGRANEFESIIRRKMKLIVDRLNKELG